MVHCGSVVSSGDLQMQYINLIKEYWAALDALQVAESIELDVLQDENLIYTLAAAIPQLKAAVEQKRAQLSAFAIKPSPNVFAVADDVFQCSEAQKLMIENLRTFKRFDQGYGPLYRTRLALTELVLKEFGLIRKHTEMVDAKVHLYSAIFKMVTRFAPIDETTNKLIITAQLHAQLAGYKDLLSLYEPARSPFVLTVEIARKLTTMDDMVNWVHGHALSASFKEYYEKQLLQWAGHTGKWDMIPVIIARAADLKLSPEELEAIKLYQNSLPVSFQRAGQYVLTTKEMLSHLVHTNCSASAQLKMQEVLTSMTTKGLDLNRAMDDVRVFEHLLENLKILSRDLTPHSQAYANPKDWGFLSRYVYAGEKTLRDLMRDGLSPILAVVDNAIAQLEKMKLHRADENDAVICAKVRDETCAELYKTFLEFEGLCVLDTRVLPKVKREMVHDKVKPCLEKFFKTCKRSFQSARSDDDDELIDMDDNHFTPSKN